MTEITESINNQAVSLTLCIDLRHMSSCASQIRSPIVQLTGLVINTFVQTVQNKYIVYLIRPSTAGAVHTSFPLSLECQPDKW